MSNCFEVELAELGSYAIVMVKRDFFDCTYQMQHWISLLEPLWSKTAQKGYVL